VSLTVNVFAGVVFMLFYFKLLLPFVVNKDDDFRKLLQLTNTFQHVQCRRNIFEIISEPF